jgi:hypothetical protein
MCKIIRSLYNLISIPGFRAFLLQNHISSCPKCQKEWSIDETMEELFGTPGWIEKEASLWPRIQETIQATAIGDSLDRTKNRTSGMVPRWQWALAGFALLLLAGINIIVNKGPIRRQPLVEVDLARKPPQIEIIRAEIHGQKAKPFIYRTQDNLFIWFDKIDQEED